MTKDEISYLEQIVEECRKYSDQGKLAGYIPELANAPKHALGITVQKIGEEGVSVGDCNQTFTAQSISKVFSLLAALMGCGETKVFEKVGKEPTGDVYDSMLKLETIEPGKPFNPLINAGAIAIANIIPGKTKEEKYEHILALMRLLSKDNTLTLNEAVYRSESKTASRNRALAYVLQDNQILEGDVEETLDVYFRQCSIEITCSHLAQMGMILANEGVDPESGKELIPRRYVRIVKTFMVTCGMYNASGEFAIEVGIPAKSGVSGGILAFVPGKMGIGIVGPALDEKGNSISGIQLLQRLSDRWNLSMF